MRAQVVRRIGGSRMVCGRAAGPGRRLGQDPIPRRAALGTGEVEMDPVLVGAVIVLVVVLAIFSAISLLGLVGPSKRW